MSSLGFRARCDHNAERVPASATISIAPAPLPAPTPRRILPALSMSVPRGFLPLLFYAASAMLFPLIYFYVSLDFSDDVVRALAIGASGVLGLMLVLANDCCTWYNMALFFHTGIEVVVLDQTMDYIDLSTTSDTGKVLAWIGFATVIVHLIPFFVIDRPRLLTLLALVGVPVNAALTVYTQPLTALPVYYVLVTLSSTGLLLVTSIVLGIDGHAPSMLTKLRCALRDGTFFVC